jgi:predicted MFS family arabinose efflux permease
MKKTNPTAPLPPEAHGHTARTREPYPRPAAAWYATILLALLYWISLLDRTIISLMVDPIKRDLGITDVQFGMLHGLAFAITFCVFGLAAGALADRVNRRRLIYLCVTIWSLATAACGIAQNFHSNFINSINVSNIIS